MKTGGLSDVCARPVCDLNSWKKLRAQAFIYPHPFSALATEEDSKRAMNISFRNLVDLKKVII